jgi:cysteine-rich repeat protein
MRIHLCVAIAAAMLALTACRDLDEPATGGRPASWTCAPAEYGDGLVCHCDCGAPDPDCSNPGLIVSGCLLGQACSADGTCSDCGNGVLDPGEQCDAALPDIAECAPLGYAPGQVPCDATCRWAYDQCQPLASCGNGALDGGELCDGPAIKPGLSCADFGAASGALACAAGCRIDTAGCFTCGDGVLEGAEACDDGGPPLPSDGCSGTCTVETGWQCTGAPSQCAPRCGDGLIVGGEHCDDGDADDGDGCSASCQVENGCTCTGLPSQCTCVRIEPIAPIQDTYVEAASLALDGAGHPHAAYAYGDVFIDPDGHEREHAHVIAAERSGSTWTRSEVEAFDANRAGIDRRTFALAADGGVLRLLYHRMYNPTAALAVATRGDAGWQITYDHPFYVHDAIRAGGTWHALLEQGSWSGVSYVSGAPGAWTRDEPLPIGAGELAVAPTGDVYLTGSTYGGQLDAYTVRLHRRVDAGDWATLFEHTTTAPPGKHIYPLHLEPLALPDGGLIAFSDIHDATGGRWLRALRDAGAAGWVVDDVADLSCHAPDCWVYEIMNMAFAIDPLGRPHVLLTPGSSLAPTTIEDHYRDADGWHARSLPLTGTFLYDAHFDAAGTAHLLVSTMVAGTAQLAYVSIDAGAW